LLLLLLFIFAFLSFLFVSQVRTNNEKVNCYFPALLVEEDPAARPCIISLLGTLVEQTTFRKLAG
jgi:hypothetical protein